MAESSNEVVITENMLTVAARAGDSQRLTIWAQQGVRATSAVWGLLRVAVKAGHLDVLRCLVRGLGVDINQATANGLTSLHLAASRGQVAVVQCLVELGAEVGAVAFKRYTALNMSAAKGHYSTMQYLLEETGANTDDVNNRGQTAWELLIEHLKAPGIVFEEADEDPAALNGLLRVLVLRGVIPPALMALLSPELARVVQERARLRARLPAYLVHRRAYLDLRCPRISLLPEELQALIYAFEGPATTEELWATGLSSTRPPNALAISTFKSISWCLSFYDSSTLTESVKECG
jgi:hypothetical protein